MRLVSLHTTDYKSITDAGQFTVEPDITCLVGKNESGKSTVLESIYRLKPLAGGHPTKFEALRDYPRRYYGRDKDKIAGKRVVSAQVRLDDTDLKALEDRFGVGTFDRTQIVSKGYGNERTWVPGGNVDAAFQAVKRDSRISDLNLDGVEDEDQLRTLLESKDSPSEDHQAILQELKKPLVKRLQEGLSNRLPHFLYFSDYDLLPGTVSISRLQSVNEYELDPGERTALSLLRLAGVATDEFTEENYEARKAALEAAANTLTDEVFEFWRQNQNLEVELDIEFRSSDETGTKLDTPEPWLQIRIRNTRHRVTLNFSERSRGFVWFFSFLAYFSEYRNSGRRLLLLLDEPGLNLHGTAQEDLLRFIEERLASDYQIIYTTHSPFMIDSQRLERTRLVEDLERVGTVVKDDALGTSGETQFPLHAAIGIRATQTLFIGQNSLIVEGNADLMYLKTVSAELERRGMEGLSSDWVITPVGGLDKMPTFVALLGAQVHVVALHDSPAGGVQKLDDLVRKGVIDPKQLVPLTDFIDGKEGDIEDMFDVDWYLELLGESGIGSVQESDLARKKGRVVARIEDSIGEFSHYAPARYLASEPALAERVSDDAAQRWSSLVSRLNSLLSES